MTSRVPSSSLVVQMCTSLVW